MLESWPRLQFSDSIWVFPSQGSELIPVFYCPLEAEIGLDNY